MPNKYDGYMLPELQNLVTKMNEDIANLRKEFAKFQQQQTAAVTKAELERNKIDPRDPEFAAANQNWINMRSQADMAIRQQQQNLQRQEQELGLAQDALNRKQAEEDEKNKE